jgi:hypothetical protein
MFEPKKVEVDAKMSSWKIEKEKEDNIKIHLMDIGCEDGRWMELAHDRFQ